jgi:dTDP-4-amino-4,6-dideoxygalactose transaminase
LFVVRSAHRDALQAHLLAQGVHAQVHYPVAPHRQLAYAGELPETLPLTERLHDEVLSLPIGPTLDHGGVERVVAACMSFRRPA